MRASIFLMLLMVALPVQAGSSHTKKDNSPKVITTDSGLKYADLVVGTGDVPHKGDTVSIHYVGTLEDGTIFDSSRERKSPFTFKVGVGQVIAGFDEGILSMHVGGLRKLWIPASLGYGQHAIGKIPAGATLIFEVELLSVTR